MERTTVEKVVLGSTPSEQRFWIIGRTHEASYCGWTKSCIIPSTGFPWFQSGAQWISSIHGIKPGYCFVGPLSCPGGRGGGDQTRRCADDLTDQKRSQVGFRFNIKQDIAGQGVLCPWPLAAARRFVYLLAASSGTSKACAGAQHGFLGVDSPFCSTIVLFKHLLLSQGFCWFSRKKDPCKEWGSYP